VPHAFSPPLTTSDSSLLVDGRDDAMRETIYLMVLSLDRLQTCREAFGRAMDLTGSQFAVLMGVAYTQGRIGVSIGALAIHVHLAATHVTTEVGRLIRLGLLEKVPSPTDRRSVLVSLTQKGEEAVQSVAPLVRSVNDRLFAGMSREDLGQVHEFFTRFALNSEFALVELRHKDVRKRPAPARTRTELLP
jgi:DNA-binding MarR family transcriptional regulator